MGGYVGLGSIVGYDDCGMHTTIEVHLTFSEACSPHGLKSGVPLLR